MIRTIATIAATWIAGGVFLLALSASQASSQSTGPVEAQGRMAKLSENPQTPEQLIKGQSPCQATLTEVLTRLPKQYGTRWVFADLDDSKIAGLYFPGRNVAALSDTLPCELVGTVAAHEWAHTVQDVEGLTDRTMINGYARFEYVAECTARVIATHEEWPTIGSYPELGGVPCSEFTADVQDLLSRT